MTILNLTQHAPTPDQIDAGVVDLTLEEREALIEALTFDELPAHAEIVDRAQWVAALAAQHEPVALEAMIGGAPYLMAPLEHALRNVGIAPVYAFSTRESVDQPQPDGTVRKTNVFRHVGFVKA